MTEIPFKAKSTKNIVIDASTSALKKYGFHCGERVNTIRGHATVIGVSNDVLWFYVDDDKGITYWKNIKDKTDLARLNITSLENKEDIATNTDD